MSLSVPDMVIDSMVAKGKLKEELRSKVREAMLKKHHHQNERKLSNRIPLVRSIADIGKKHSDPLLLERNGETPPPPSVALLFLFRPCLLPSPLGGGETFPIKKKEKNPMFKSLGGGSLEDRCEQ